MSDKVVYSGNGLTIAEDSIRYNDKKIYVNNIAGYTYNNALPKRIACAIFFVLGIIGIFLYYQSFNDLLVVGILSFVITGASLAMFFNNLDALTIQSNASILQINYTLGMKDDVKVIMDAIDKVKK